MKFKCSLYRKCSAAAAVSCKGYSGSTDSGIGISFCCFFYPSLLAEIINTVPQRFKCDRTELS